MNLKSGLLSLFCFCLLTINQSFGLDLVMTGLAMSGSNISVTVKNDSQTTVSGFYVLINANGKSKYLYMSTMAAQTSRTVSTSAIYFGTGSASVYAWADAYAWRYESNENNNSMTRTLNLGGSSTIGSSVDLVVEDIRFQDPYFFVKVKNQGGASTYQSSYLRVCLNGTCRSDYTSSPGPGASYEKTYNKSQFYVTTSGSKSVTAHIDYNNYVTESNENNNYRSEVGSFGSSASLPDLVVTNIEYKNGGIDVTFKNQGTVTTNGDIQIRLERPGTSYARTRTYYGNSTYANYPLFAGTSKTISFTISEMGLTSGFSGSLKATVDYSNVITESSEANNVKTQAVSYTVYRPDMIVQSARIDGDNLKVALKNQGNSAVTPSHYTQIKINGRTKTIYSSADIAAGGTLELSTSLYSFYLSDGLSYTAEITADAYRYVSESNESNNTKSISLQTADNSAAADLSILSANDVGTRFLVQVKNIGSSSTGRYSYLRVTLNNGSSRTYYVGTLASGASSYISVYKSSFTMVDGINYFDFEADTYDWVDEADETNNELSLEVDQGNSLPDLVARDIYFEGNYLRFKYENTSSQTLTANYGIYLRVFLGSVVKTISLPSVTPGVHTYSWSLSSLGLTAGSTFSGSGHIDYYNYITESSESNNTVSKSLTTPGGGSSSAGVDLTIEKVERYVSSGRYLYAKVTWKNSGSSIGSALVDVKLEYGASSLTSSRTYSNYATPSPGGTRTTYIYMGYVTSYPAGTASIKVTVDANNEQPEADESNNTYSSSNF